MDTVPASSNSVVVAPQSSAWDTHLQPAGCSNCRQAFLVPAGRLGESCPVCARAALEPQPAVLQPRPPERILPFTQERAAVRSHLDAFIQPVWFKPPDLNVDRLMERLTVVYWPMWLVDATLDGSWQAEVGFDYQVKSSQESFRSGSWVSQEVVETRVRWEPRVGQIRRRFENIVTPALMDHNAHLEKTGPYQLDVSQPFESEDIEGAVLHLPDMQPENAWPIARDQFVSAAARDCQTAAAVKHLHEFSLQVEYSDQNWTQLLLPLYTTRYVDDEGQQHPIWINGQTGKVYGVRMASQKQGQKWGLISLGAALLVFIFSLLLTGLGAVLPPAAALGGLFVLVSAGLLLTAAVLALWPWQWNRSQPDS